MVVVSAFPDRAHRRWAGALPRQIRGQIRGQLLGLLLMAASLAAPLTGPTSAWAQDQAATPVGVGTAEERLRRQTAPVVGRLVPRRAGEVAAQSAGAVDHMAVEVGDVVEAGDLLAQLDIETLRLEVDLAEANVQQREAALEQARSTLALSRQALDRLTALRRSSAFSQASFDDKAEEVSGNTHAVAVSQAALASARASLSLAETALRDATIRAPYPGVVTQRHTEVGAYVSTGQPVVSLLNNRDLEIEADIPYDLVDGLAPGQVVRVTLDDGTAADAILRAIVPAENARTRTRLARLTLPREITDEHVLAANQSVTLRLPDGPEQIVLTVPKDAVINKPTGAMVFVVVDGLAQPHSVTLGPAVDDTFQVLDGLTAGDTVVTRGNERLRPGQPVTPTVPPSARDTTDAEAPAPAANPGPEG